MIERIGRPAMLEQLAEECAELGKAALKYSRVLRRENPTPVTEEEAFKSLMEEWTDVLTCANELTIPVDLAMAERKQKRFQERWSKSKGNTASK